MQCLVSSSALPLSENDSCASYFLFSWQNQFSILSENADDVFKSVTSGLLVILYDVPKSDQGPLTPDKKNEKNSHFPVYFVNPCDPEISSGRKGAWGNKNFISPLSPLPLYEFGVILLVDFRWAW